MKNLPYKLALLAALAIIVAMALIQPASADDVCLPTTTTTELATTTTSSTTTTTEAPTTTSTTLPAVIPTPKNGQIWAIGDSRGKGGTGFTGWCSSLLDIPSNTYVKNFCVSGMSFSQGTTFQQWFDAVKAPRGWPTKVYISGNVNDAYVGVDATAQIQQFHDYLTAHGVTQVWGTAPYTSGTTPALAAMNPLVATMNANETWATNCAGQNPNPFTIDGIHPNNTDSTRFRNCMSGAGA